MNILAICSDTFRYDHLGFVGRQNVLTPNLDRLARESACFTDFQLCSFPTVVNRIEVFSGSCAFPRVGWQALPYHFPVLAQVFQRHGFATALIADNVQVMKPEYHFSRGFDYVKRIPGQQHHDFLPEDAPMIELPCPVEKLDASPKRLARYRRNAYWYRQRGTNATECVFRETMRYLERAPKKFFLWIDSFDPHEPWDAPKRYVEKYPWDPQGAEVIWPHSGRASQYYSPADLVNMRSLYKAEVTQTDFWIGELLDCLGKQKLLNQTIVIFCSDHGHYFGEHNMIGKFMKRGADRPTTIYEEVGHLPLLVRHPEGLAAGQTVGGLCQPQDLLPTLLEFAEIPPVPWTEGNSLVPRLRGQRGTQQVAIGGCHPHKGEVSCLTVWTDEWCLVYSPLTGLDGAELFHRQRDPLQTQNVLTSNHPEAERLYDLLVRWLEQLKIPAARRQQLLHADNFGWVNQLKHRFWMLGNRCSYLRHYRNYAAAKRRQRSVAQSPMTYETSLRDL
jgi:arylsulfatase A-like enzyme